MVRRHNHHMERDDWQQSQQQQLPQDGRYPLAMRPAQLHDHPLTIAQALREHAGVPVKAFALVAILDNGHERLFASNKDARIDPRPIWNELRGEVVRGGDGRMVTPGGQGGIWPANSVDSTGAFAARNSSNERRLRRQQRDLKFEDSDDDSLSSSRRKRSRPSGFGRRSSNDVPPLPITSTTLQPLRIGDSEEVEKYYVSRFKDLQQTACKIIGKVFVKLVEPKKQTHHPYTKGDENSPPWWPPTNGHETVRVRHKEPDHLLKQERVTLCVWILRLVVQPKHKQHESIRHLGLTVKKLEESTTEKLKEFFNDGNHPNNANKKKYLKELFRIAKKEEQYLDGGIDGDTMCSVMNGADTRDDYESSEDEGDPRDSQDDEFQDVERPHLSMRTPPSELPSPQLIHPQSQPESTPGEMFPSPDRRSHSIGFAHQESSGDHQYSDPAIFGRSIAMGFHSPIPSEHDRRSFASPAYAQSQNPYGWTSSHPNMVSTPTMVSPFYPTPPPLPGPSNNLYPSASMASMTQTPPLLPPLQSHQVYEQHQRYDVNAGLSQQLRPNNSGQPHAQITPSSSFGEYSEMNGFGQHEHEFKDSHLHHPQN